MTSSWDQARRFWTDRLAELAHIEPAEFNAANPVNGDRRSGSPGAAWVSTTTAGSWSG